MEEKTNKLGVFKTAQIKRMAMGIKPIAAKVDRLTSKIEDLVEQRTTLYSQISEIHNCIKAYVGDDSCLEEIEKILAEVLEGKKVQPVEEAEKEEKLSGETIEIEEAQEDIPQESPIEETEAPGEEFEPGIKEEINSWTTK